MTGTAGSARCTILLVDDHDLIRRGLREAFDSDESFVVVGEAGTLAQALLLADQLRPMVVVLDVNLPDGSGLDAARRLRAAQPELGIVMLTMSDDDDYLFGALEAKASAFVLKSSPAEQVLTAARHAAAAPLAFSAGDLAGALQRRLTCSPPLLTAREHEVLVLLSTGSTIALIAKQLFLSESTAKGHASKLYAKLQATNRSQAVVEAIRLGLLSVAPAGQR